MTTFDSIQNFPPNHIAKDTVFVPLYLNKNPLYMSEDTSNSTTPTQYITDILSDSVPLQNQRPTMFKEKSFVHNDLVLHKNNVVKETDWIFLVILSILILTAFLTKFAGNIYLSFIQGCFSKNQICITTKDGNIINALSLIPVTFIFLPLCSFIIYIFFDYYGLFDEYQTLFESFPILKNNFLLWIGIYLLVIIIYYLKIFFIKLFAWIFKAKKISNFYVQIQLNFSILMGFLLFLPTIFAIYSGIFLQEFFLWASLLIIVILYIIKLFRCFYSIIALEKFSHIYLFFYLCTLEFLPILVILKALL